jgi:4'-phosphopantetheinyl transferase EntD
MIGGMTGFWQRLFSRRVHALGGAIAEHQAALTAQEAALTAGMVPARRAEFVAGRTLARQALAGIGIRAAPLLRDAHGAPRWPPGVKGSITHVRDGGIACCAVAVSGEESVLSVGLDAEPRAALPQRLRLMVLTERESAMLAALPADTSAWADRLLFSAKECTYKSLYPLTGRFLDFHDIEVDVDFGAGEFTACIRQPAVGAKRVWRLPGRFATDGSLIATGMELNRLHITQSRA